MPVSSRFISISFNHILLFYSFLLIFTSLMAQEIGTAKLLGAPKIYCGESFIRVTIVTNEPFEGNVYAKGFFDKENCRVHGDSTGNTANISIPISNDCGMRRRRIINPKGIALEMTMVLMLHPKFLTKNDQSFNIKCLYRESTEKFTNKLVVGMLPSTEPSNSVSIESDAVLPKCKYDVLNEEHKSLSFATIGQPVIHRWSCSKEESDSEDESISTYCLTVHSCSVDDGHGNEQKLLDFTGCPTDKSLMDEINYESDLEASRKSFVFKFADKPTIYFSCQLRLEPKSDFDEKCSRIICPPTTSKTSENFAGTSITYETDFPRPKITVSPIEVNNDNAIIKSHSILVKQSPEEYTDVNSSPNDSLEASHYARHAQHFPNTTPDYTDEIHLGQSHMISPINNITQEDVPLPTIPPIDADRFHKLTTEFGQNSVEIDVATPLSVLDLSPLDSDGGIPASKTNQRNVIDTTSSKQVCVSRQVLSALILALATVLLLMSLVFGAALWRFVKRPRVVVMPRQDPFEEERRRVLSAFHP